MGSRGPRGARGTPGYKGATGQEGIAGQVWTQTILKNSFEMNSCLQ